MSEQAPQIRNLGALRVEGDQYNTFFAPEGRTLVSNVEAPPPAFLVPRESLLRQVADTLERGEGAAMHSAMARGEGGQGKTWLARHYAHRYHDRYPGGMRFISCDNDASFEALLAEAWGPEEGVDQMERARKAHAVLSREPRWLLILDNLESEERLQALRKSGLWPTRHCHVLVTTRETLNLPRVDVGRLTEAEALELLARYAPSTREVPDAAKRILTEAEGLAVLVAAVGAAIQGQSGDDVAAYADWLAQYQPDDEALGAVEGYPVKAAAILDDLYRRLDPVSLRALEYAAMCPADRIRLEWLEWLLEADQPDLDWPDRPLVGGKRPASTFLEGLQKQELLVPVEEGRFSLHRLHRKQILQARIDNVEVIYRTERIRALMAIKSDAGVNAYHRAHVRDAIEGWSQGVDLAEGLRALLEPRDEWQPGLQNDLASAYMDRGAALVSAQDLRAAIADYGRSITIREDLRTLMEPRGEWRPGLQNGLAITYSNRGVALASSQDVGAAIRDYERAITIMEGLRRILEPRGEWQPGLQNDLASAYMNCGNALESAHKLAEAIEGYRRSIMIMEGLRLLLEPKREWKPDLQNRLAHAYMGRGNALASAQCVAEAIADYGRSVTMREGLRSRLEAQGEWQPRLKNDLAAVYMNRGNALKSAGNLGAAVADYGQSILIMKGLRTLLEPRGEWQPALQNDLASGYMNRGNALAIAQEFAEAIADYGRSITIREDLKALLKPRGEWHPGLQSDLAGTYMNRGVAHARAQNFLAGIDDHGRSITIMEGLRDLLIPTGEWRPGPQKALAKAYMNRGNAYQSAQDLGAAIADYGRSITIMEGLRDLLEPRGEWQPALQNDLASAYVNRGVAYQSDQDLGAAIADYGRSITIREGLARNYPTFGTDLQRTITNWFLARHGLSDELVRLAAANNARLRTYLTAEVLNRNEVPKFNRWISENLDAVPDLDPAEAERIRAALLAPLQ